MPNYLKWCKYCGDDIEVEVIDSNDTWVAHYATGVYSKEGDKGKCLSSRDGLHYPYQREPIHSDYPHFPGGLHGCPACESKCHCEPGNSECVFEGEHNGLGVPCDD